MLKLSYFTLAAFSIGMIVTLMLAAWLTPARWWRQLNARALAIACLGTWGIGSLILWLAQPRAPLMAAVPATHAVAAIARAAPPAAGAGRSYRVFEDLNVRASRGTGARRIAVVPAGALVTTTGVRDGDWWQVNTRIDGKDVHGWSSSLWLRRADE